MGGVMLFDSMLDARAWAFERLLQNRFRNQSDYQNMGMGGLRQSTPISFVMTDAEVVAQWLWNGPDKPCEKCGK